VFSEPDTAKVRHVRAGSAVQVHLETGAFGNEVVVLDVAAEVSERPAADWLPEFRDGYVTKYATAIDDYGMALDDIAARFSTVLVSLPPTSPPGDHNPGGFLSYVSVIRPDS
jgi:hypothetical protein